MDRGYIQDCVWTVYDPSLSACFSFGSKFQSFGNLALGAVSWCIFVVISNTSKLLSATTYTFDHFFSSGVSWLGKSIITP